MERLIGNAYRAKPERRLIPTGGQENFYWGMSTLIRPLRRENKVPFVKTYQPEADIQQAEVVVVDKNTSLVARARRFLRK